MYSPLLFITDRVAVKDFKIGKYTIYKGTAFSYPIDAIMHDYDIFKDSMTLRFDRYAKDQEDSEQVAQTPYLVFSSGKRGCLGRFLGELMIQMISIKLVKKFELKPLENKEYKAAVRFTYGPDNCYIRIKPR